MTESLQALANAVRTMALQNGENKTKSSILTLYRYTGRRIELPQQCTPYLFLILDGSMRLHTPSGILDYIAGQYSISAIDYSKA